VKSFFVLRNVRCTELFGLGMHAVDTTEVVVDETDDEIEIRDRLVVVAAW
jgi:hypothetical protein